MENILIIRLSSLGDVLLVTPVIRALKNKFPNAKLHFLVKKEYADVVKFHPAISGVIEYDRNIKTEDFVEQIQKENIDFIIDLQNNFRSRKIVKKISVKNVKYVKPTLKKFLLVNFGLNLYKSVISIPEMYINKIPGLTLDEKGLELYVPDTVVSSLHENEKLIGLCPGAKHFTKRWPAEYFIELGNSLIKKGYQVVILGGLDDKDICDIVAAGISGSINSAHVNDIFQIAADMKKCKLIICNDSGLMHTATAVNIPVITLFGSSVKEFGFAPYKSANLVLENNNLSCKPCSHIGRDKCPKKHFECMKKITPQLVETEFHKFTREL